MVLEPALPDGSGTDFGGSCTGSDGFSTVLQGLEKSVEMENLVLPLKDVSDQVYKLPIKYCPDN